MGITRNDKAYGFNNGLQSLAPQPIIANRAPTTADFAPLMSLWDYKASNLVWVLTSVVNNQANWLALVGGGGAGVFASLTVTPGPTSITGTTGINTSGAGVTTINTGGTGALNLGNATGGTTFTGLATLAAMTQAGVANINTTGTATTTIGNVTGATTVDINSGTGGTGLTSTGIINASSSNSGSGAVTLVATNAAGGVLINPGATLGPTAGLNLLQGANAASIQVGSGAPSHAASQGTLYLNHAGSGVADRAYLNTNGSTGWAAITTAS